MMRHCRIAFFLCLSFVIQLVVAQPIFANPYSDGLVLYNKGRFQPAVVKFEEAVRNNPEDSNAQYYRALNYQRLGDTNKARAGYQAIMQKFPGSQAAQYAGQVLGAGKAASRQSTNSRNQGDAENDPDSQIPPYMRPPKDLAQLPDGATIYYKQLGEWMSVDAEINGRQLPVVFDTGATVCVIGKNQLRELNLSLPVGPPTGTGGGFGSGRQVPIWSIKADVKFGTIFRRNFPLQVYEYLGTPPLIGQVFVRDYDVTVDASSKTIRLTKKATNRTARQTLGSNAVPFRMEGPKITVMAEVNGKPYPVWFDTGNDSGIVMHALDAKSLNINIPDDALMGTATGAAGTTRMMQFPISRLKLGPIERNDFVINVDLDSEPGGRPCLGQQFLSGWQYTIDNDTKTIQFVRR